MTEMDRFDDDDLDVIDRAKIVWRYRWMISLVCFGALVITLAILLWVPKIYESTALVLAPKETGGPTLGAVSAALGVLGQMPGLPSSTANRDQLVSILNSRTVMDGLIERFDLRRRYDADYKEDVIKKLQSRTNITVTREGAVSITVGDTDPKIAAAMANFYVDQADRLVAQYGTGEGGRQRVFLAQQLARANADLEKAEVKLQKFQERNGVVALPDQTRGMIDAVARVEADIVATQVQLQVMKEFATDANPDVIKLRRQMQELRQQSINLQRSAGFPSSTASMPQNQVDFKVPFPKVPEVGLELARLTRDVKVKELLMTLLIQQVEQAKLTEAKDLPSVQILDRSVPAERYARPVFALHLSLAGVTSLFAGIFLAFSIEHVKTRRERRAPDPVTAAEGLPPLERAFRPRRSG